MPEPEMNLGDFNKIIKPEGYKPSRFNVRTEDRHGNLLLTNTYSNRFIRVASTEKEAVIEILKKPNSELKNQDLFEGLVQRGFIIPAAVNEFKRAELKHSNTIASEGRLSLILMPNEDCNFRCTYCYESFAKNYMQDHVQKGIINFLKKNLRKYTELHIDWFGGEPLTAVPIIEHLSEQMIELCAKHRVRYSAGMTTNGYNLTLDVFKKMQKCRVSKYQITLDGLAKHHDKARVRADGQSTFEIITNNLRDIRDNVKTQTFKIALRSNVTRPIYEEIDQFLDFFKEEFGDDNRFYSHLHATSNWGGDSVKTIENTFCTSKDIISAINIGVDKGVNITPLYDDMLKDTVCYASKKNNFIIGSDGIIYKCTIAFEDEENHVGVLTENGIMNLDEDKLSTWVTGHETTDPGCQSCFFRPSCQGATCPLTRLYTAKSPCPPVKTNIKDYMRIVASQSPRVEDLEVSYK